MPLHADTFNQWFADSSDGEKRSFFEGMKAAVLSDDFREKANTHVEKIDPALSFTVGGDVFSKSSIADELLEHINK
ncbi:MAG: hypothetical protein EON58_03075 [Alphaproteobacteria bacterium]|nr:MAG: hypothetical protein EON58_03075 [Alphaproteobacteria bacterium]